MCEIVLMTIEHAFGDLPDKTFSSILVQPFGFGDKIKQLASLEILHYNDNFHVLKS